jgi:hypothetical protein
MHKWWYSQQNIRFEDIWNIVAQKRWKTYKRPTWTPSEIYNMNTPRKLTLNLSAAQIKTSHDVSSSSRDMKIKLLFEDVIEIELKQMSFTFLKKEEH